MTIRLDQLREDARVTAYTGPFRLDESFLDSAAYFKDPDQSDNSIVPPLFVRKTTGMFQLDFSRLDSSARFNDGPPYPDVV